MNNQQQTTREPQLNIDPQQSSQLQPAQTFLKRWMPTIAGVVVVVLVGGGVFAYQTWWSEPIEPTTEESQEQEAGTTPTEFPETGERVAGDETADWRTYRSERYGFEIKYPNDWIMTNECDEKFEYCGENWMLVTNYVPAPGPRGDYTGAILVSSQTYNSIQEAVQDRLSSVSGEPPKSCSIETLSEEDEMGKYKVVWGHVTKKNVFDTEGQVNCLNISYYFSKEKRYFAMGGGFENERFANIVNKMLSTFRFIN